MTGIIKAYALAIFVPAMANAATISSTMTVSASGPFSLTSPTVALTGTANLTNVGSGSFSATVPISVDTSGNLTATFTISLTGGSNSLTGTIKIPESALLSGAPNTAATASITGGSGGYAGATGSFSLLGSGSLTGTTISVSFSGAGTINTTGGSSGPAPSITAVQNNFSYILPGLPNYGIAPGSLFIVKGNNLNNQPLTSLQSSAAPGLPLTLNGTSISVTVNGTTTTPAIYYTSPTQLAAVLPSTTPVGSGTITVTNGSQTSAAATILVVQSALGLDTLYGSGVGQGIASDPNFNFLGPTNSAGPGEVINLWGSGVGADPANDDRTYPLKLDNLTGIPMQVYIGGVAASVSYRGRSQYPGVDQVQVTVPTGVPSGCFVSVVAVSGSIVSNTVTIPVTASPGGTCSDPNLGTVAFLTSNSTVNFGYLALKQSTSPGTGGSSVPVTSNSAIAEFESQALAAFGSASGAVASIGSCIVNVPTGSGSVPTNGLDAGAITLNGPGSAQTLSAAPAVPGFYSATLPAGYLPAGGGAFTFVGAGGATVGKFSTTLNYPGSFNWTNSVSISAVSRSQGVEVTWTGGASGTYVTIGGTSTATAAGQTVSASFTCEAPVSAGQFTVPSYVLLALPAGSGTLEVNNLTNPIPFTATGLDFGYSYAASSVSINAVYN